MPHLEIDLMRDGAMRFAVALDAGNVPLASFDAGSIAPAARSQLLTYLCEVDPDLLTSIAIARALGTDVTLHVTLPSLPWQPGVYDMTVTRAGQPRTLRMYMPTGALPATRAHVTRRVPPPLAAV